MTREESLKILRDVHDKALFSVRNALETLIPELADSEDERIRNLLRRIVITANDGDLQTLGDNDTNKCLAWLKKLKEQQPAEWSEEDEDFINMLILHFNYLIDKGGDSVETYKSYREKLKSLRPSWKPSEEEMDALKETISQDCTVCNGDRKWIKPNLESLYEQLKAL